MDGATTSWGHPNLSGTWSTDDMRGIPCDRPEALGTQEFVSDEQFIERAKRQQAGSSMPPMFRLSIAWRTACAFSASPRSWSILRTAARPRSLPRKARAEAVAARAGSAPVRSKFEDFTLYDRCIARGIPAGMSAVLYGNGMLITQSPDSVTITYEMVHETRAIPLDSRPQLPGGVTQYNGNSRGHWDGDTLVVECSGFTDNTGIGPAHRTAPA